MSVRVMSLVFEAKLPDINLTGKTVRRVTAPTLKLVLLALGDHCNDDGDGAYPSLVTLEHKTGMAHSSVINSLSALKSQGFILRSGISKRGTTNYSINVPMLKSLVHQVDYPNQASLPGVNASTPGDKTSTPGAPESSFNHPSSIHNNKENNKIPFMHKSEEEPALHIFTDTLGRFTSLTELQRWLVIVELVGVDQSKEIVAWAARREIDMINRAGLMNSLETAAKKWEEKQHPEKHVNGVQSTSTKKTTEEIVKEVSREQTDRYFRERNRRAARDE